MQKKNLTTPLSYTFRRTPTMLLIEHGRPAAPRAIQTSLTSGEQFAFPRRW